MSRWMRLILPAFIFCSGCGTYLPPIDYRFDDDFKAGAFINTVVSNVRCQLGNAVLDAENGAGPTWLKNWSAEVTLTLNISEKTGISAGATEFTLLPGSIKKFVNGTSVASAQSFVFGFGGGGTLTSGRIVALTWYDNFSDFKGAGVDCDAGSFITGDLKLKEVLFAATFVGTVPGNMSKMYDPNGPYQNVQDTITFDVDTNANATPMWHYINVGVNTSGTFVNVDRDRKDMLLITMGPPPASSKVTSGKKASTSSFGSNDVSTIHNLSRIVSPLQ